MAWIWPSSGACFPAWVVQQRLWRAALGLGLALVGMVLMEQPGLDVVRRRRIPRPELGIWCSASCGPLGGGSCSAVLCRRGASGAAGPR